MVILSLLIILIDLRPNIILNVLKGTSELFKVHEDIHLHFYSFNNIKASVITIVYGFIIYMLIIILGILIT